MGHKAAERQSERSGAGRLTGVLEHSYCPSETEASLLQKRILGTTPLFLLVMQSIMFIDSVLCQILLSLGKSTVKKAKT